MNSEDSGRRPEDLFGQPSPIPQAVDTCERVGQTAPKSSLDCSQALLIRVGAL